MTETLAHCGAVWRWQGGGNGSWFFLTLDGAAGEALSATALMRRLESGRRPGWGSLRVTATIGDSRWQTSVFPDKARGWLLPLRKSVRDAQGLCEGAAAQVTLEF